MQRFVPSFREHWPEYAIEAAGIALFMLSALGFTVLLEHTGSPLRALVAEAFPRRALMGLAMGGTAVALVYSRWGQRSGAHFNPALTFTYWWLGRVQPADALGYALAQFAGAVAGVAAAAALLGALPADPHVHFAVTRPGAGGAAVAFAAEVAISAGLMLAVLAVSNSRANRFTGLAAGALVALYIAFEAPLSGMSMNPARTLGSAAGAGHFEHLWIYFAAPPLGMGLGAALYLALPRVAGVRCAKLHHENRQRCIFRCGYAAARRSQPWSESTS